MSRYRVSYAHREPPSRGSRASPLHLSMEQRAGRLGKNWRTNRKKSRRRKKKKKKKKKKGQASANSFDPGIASRYLSTSLEIESRQSIKSRSWSVIGKKRSSNKGNWEWNLSSIRNDATFVTATQLQFSTRSVFPLYAILYFLASLVKIRKSIGSGLESR